MSQIQVDMFEVQLGAGILLQFHTKQNEPIRILADAGVSKQSGYPQGHVHRKLKAIFAECGDTSAQVDLIIGTHYDEDHLRGLVPIINDSHIKIIEVWLPPVANELEAHGRDDDPEDRNLLALQLAGEQGERILRDYLGTKAGICRALYELELLAGEITGQERQWDRLYDPFTLRERPPGNGRVSVAESLQFFEAHRSDAARRMGDEGEGHADENIPIPDETDHHLIAQVARVLRWPWEDVPHIPTSVLVAGYARSLFAERWSRDRSSAAIDARSFALIRKSQANDAIKATYLAEVVGALRARGIPIMCHVIHDGIPTRFGWDSGRRRFLRGDGRTKAEPELLLLGPSRGLVKKHWKRLPIGDYMAMAMLTRVAVEPITASNQLSYVARIKFADQALLITGDAGCVDFKPKPRGKFYARLLDSLLPLHVVQVAHHAGHNAEFYNVLLAAGYARQAASSWLLLSHATDDKHRPSRVFSDFIQAIQRDNPQVSLLFTSQPKPEKVRQFKSLIHAPTNAPARVGDVRLSFDGNAWKVEKHSILV